MEDAIIYLVIVFFFIIVLPIILLVKNSKHNYGKSNVSPDGVIEKISCLQPTAAAQTSTSIYADTSVDTIVKFTDGYTYKTSKVKVLETKVISTKYRSETFSVNETLLNATCEALNQHDMLVYNMDKKKANQRSREDNLVVAYCPACAAVKLVCKYDKYVICDECSGAMYKTGMDSSTWKYDPTVKKDKENYISQWDEAAMKDDSWRNDYNYAVSEFLRVRPDFKAN